MARYEPALDGLRAVAILLVAAFHARVPGFSAGRVGVDVFFVLSGCLITGLLLEGPTLRDFYLRRLRRLAPALLLLVAVYLWLAPILWPDDNAGLSALLASLYASDLAPQKGALLHIWSLALEMQFYLLWPFALQLPRNLLTPILIVAWLALTVLRFAVLQSADTHDPLWFSPLRSTGMILGGLIALHRPQSRAWMAPAGLALLLLAACAMNGSLRVVGLTAAEIAGALLIVGAWSPGPVRALLTSGPVVWLGTVSYGFYLWHYPIVLALRSFDWPAIFVGCLVFGTAAAWLSRITVEAMFRPPVKAVA